MIWGVPAVKYPEYKESILPFLENFASRSMGRWTVEELEAAITEREKQVWVFGEFQMVCLTSLSRESVNIEACAGIRRGEWQELLDDKIIEWGQALGKKRVIALVRPGWAKFGKSRGYREAHREMVRSI